MSFALTSLFAALAIGFLITAIIYCFFRPKILNLSKYVMALLEHTRARDGRKSNAFSDNRWNACPI